MSRLREKLRLRLAVDGPLLPVLSVVLAGMFLITLLVYSYTRNAVESLAQGQTIQNLEFLDHEVTVQVRDMVEQARMVSQEAVLRLALEDGYLGRSAKGAAQRRIEAYVKSGAFERFYLVDLKGVIVQASTPGLAGTLDISDRRYFRDARAGQSALETVPLSRVSKRPILVSSHPVRGADAAVVGVLVAIMDTESFARDILNRMRIGQDGGGYMLNDQGVMLGQPVWAAEGDFAPGAFTGEILAHADGATLLRYARQRDRRLCAAKRNETTGWTLVVEVDEDQVLAPATRLATVSAGISFFILALVALALGALRKVLVNLRNSESDHRTLTELSPVGIMTFNQQGRPVYMNMQARKLLEIGPEVALPAFIALEDADGVPLAEADTPMGQVLRQHAPVIGQMTWYRAPSGGSKALYVNATPLSGQGGQGHSLVATLEDITERMQSLQMLHESEERFSNLFRLSPDSILLTQLGTGAVVDVNEAFTNTFGYDREEVLGRTVADLNVYVDDDQRQAINEQVQRDGHVVNAVVHGRAKDGSEAVFSLSSQTMEIGKSSYRMTVVRDISEQVRAVERLKQSEERFSKLFRLSPEAVLLLEFATARITDANEAFLALSGYELEELVGRTTLDIDLYVDASRRKAFYVRLQRDGHVDNLDFEGRRKDGRSFIGSLSAQVIDIGKDKWIMALIRDITEVKKMHEMMIQTEKMISVGGIAAGIAHEINNPLGIVLQAAQNLVQRTKPDFPKNLEAARSLGLGMEQLQGYMRARKLDVFIQDIQAAALRASGIIRHMLDFSRRSESRRKVCDLPGIVDKAVTLAASDYDLKKSYDFKRIKIVREYDDDLPAINCTETEIEQVVLNLLRNAAQAQALVVPALEEPRIVIRVSGQAECVRIEIEDNGPGMTADIQRRIFEPFYTTKPPGVGTGLGLSVSYFIVTKGHGGRMSVSSQAGVGTTFLIELPLDEYREA